jgi:protein TonB
MVNRSVAFRSLGLAVIFAVGAHVVFAPARASAQQQSASPSPIYASNDLESPPKLVSTAKAAKVIEGSFSRPLRQAGLGGMVQLQLVIDTRGNVEETSIEVVETPSPALAEAARRAARRLEFTPGRYRGEAVRTRVILPIVYKTER